MYARAGEDELRVCRPTRRQGYAPRNNAARRASGTDAAHLVYSQPTDFDVVERVGSAVRQQENGGTVWERVRHTAIDCESARAGRRRYITASSLCRRLLHELA